MILIAITGVIIFVVGYLHGESMYRMGREHGIEHSRLILRCAFEDESNKELHAMLAQCGITVVISPGPASHPYRGLN
jgi:hypothetical protein